MIIQATVLASNAQALAAKTPAQPVAQETPTPSGKNTPPSGADLTTLIAQATSQMFGTKYGTATSSTTTTSGTATTTTTQSGKGSGTGTSTGSATTTLSMVLAQAAILGSGGQTPTTSTGKDLSTTTTGKGQGSASTKEKKSTTSDKEGSFLQSGTSDTSTSLSMLSMMGALSNPAGNSSANQTFTPTTGGKNSSLGGLTGGANSSTGTANVEKEEAMNSTLTSSADDLLSASGANSLVTQKQPDLQIQLSSNHDFTDALKQVMHVAQLTQTNESRTPMRVEMTIQTPPGAIVNVYVSKSGDQLRAQLGTNDPQALAWVQSQVTSLKSNDLGVEVKWLPPQMEGNTAITTSSSQDANLSWNQGGGQSDYQQPDERQQQANPNADDEPEYAGTGANSFMNTLNTFGRAA